MARIRTAREYEISDATRRNWERLGTRPTDRLAARANKSRSQRRILPLEYFSNRRNVDFVRSVLEYAEHCRSGVFDLLLALAARMLKNAGIDVGRNVQRTLGEYSGGKPIPEFPFQDIPGDEFDLLGLIYQSWLREGTKHLRGAYYTPERVAREMTRRFSFSDGETFLDPCCGSGAFLLAAPAEDPKRLYGVDKDEIAVFIAKINLMLRYPDVDFSPQVYCLDYLAEPGTARARSILAKKFDYVATNPPWGATTSAGRDRGDLASKETFSRFFVKAFGQLKEGGVIKFLFPEAMLNVKSHREIRKFILEKAGLTGIALCDGAFSGVMTKCAIVECGGRPADRRDAARAADAIRTARATEDRVLRPTTERDAAIARAFMEKGVYSLQNSVWGMGIVTGDNKRKVSRERLLGMEELFTGKEIAPYRLLAARNYIFYDRANFQQAARDEIYRAPEKLAYRFISTRPIFAYDDEGRLFLNSANLLIPRIPGMSAKTALAFLNSSLFQFMYMKLFGETKILKGNLTRLKLPAISEAEDRAATALVDAILGGDDAAREELDERVFAIYGLHAEQAAYVWASARDSGTRRSLS